MSRGTVAWKEQRSAWEVRVRLPPDPLTGQRRRVSKLVRAPQTAKGRAEAERVRTALLAEADGMRASDSSATVGQTAAMWFAVRSDEWSPTTETGYRRLWGKRVGERWADVPLRDVRRGDVLGWCDAMRASGLSLPTARRHLAILRQILSFAVERELIAVNPAKGSKLLATERRADITPPSPKQLAALLADIDERDRDLGSLVRVGAWCGMRRSELCALDWGDVDIKGAQLTVRRALVQTGRRLTLKDTKTHQVRNISLGPATIAEFRRMAESRVQTAEELSGFVWSLSLVGDEPVQPDSITAAFGRARDRVGVDCRLHDLRHYMATQMLANGEAVSTVQARLGHRKASTTLDVYTHALRARDQSAAAMIESVA